MGLLNGRFAAITGAAGPRGLGRAMAQIFAEHGATVAILDLNAAEAQAVAALKALADEGKIDRDKVAAALVKYNLDPSKPNPMSV